MTSLVEPILLTLMVTAIPIHAAIPVFLCNLLSFIVLNRFGKDLLNIYFELKFNKNISDDFRTVRNHF